MIDLYAAIIRAARARYPDEPEGRLVEALLKLHKPETFDDERWHCTECSALAGTPVWSPCRSVRFIADHLGVEVPA